VVPVLRHLLRIPLVPVPVLLLILRHLRVPVLPVVPIPVVSIPVLSILRHLRIPGLWHLRIPGLWHLRIPLLLLILRHLRTPVPPRIPVARLPPEELKDKDKGERSKRRARRENGMVVPSGWAPRRFWNSPG